MIHSLLIMNQKVLYKNYMQEIYTSLCNEEKLKDYALKAMIALEKYSGKIILRGGKSRTNEGINSPRTVVIEFPDYKTAIECYDSTEYQKAHDILKGNAIRHHQIVEGV